MNIYGHIDYTLLKATATVNDIFNLCAKAEEEKCASVCIPSGFVSIMHELFPSLTICTVVGFPLGNSSISTKVFEAKEAIESGAKEVDMVINISEMKRGNIGYIKNEIEEVKKAVGNNVLKVIIETCYLTKAEIAIVTKVVDESSADYVKTSTGFGDYGARIEDVIVMKNAIHNGTKIKASGGIRTKEDMIKYLELGCDRIGASKLP